MDYKISIKGTEWHLKGLNGGWYDVRYILIDKKGLKRLSRCQLKAMDIEAALQYIWSNYNGSIPPISVNDLEEVTR